MSRKELFSKVPLQHSVLLLLAWPFAALAQANYPTKPIRFISPYAAGDSTTAMARVVGQKLTESWGQNVIIDNRPGGNTIIGTETLAKSPPDGYTIIMTTKKTELVKWAKVIKAANIKLENI